MSGDDAVLAGGLGSDTCCRVVCLFVSKSVTFSGPCDGYFIAGGWVVIARIGLFGCHGMKLSK